MNRKLKKDVVSSHPEKAEENKKERITSKIFDLRINLPSKVQEE